MNDIIQGVRKTIIEKIIPILVSVIVALFTSLSYTAYEYIKSVDNLEIMTQAVDYLAVDLGNKNQVENSQKIEKTVIQSIVKSDNMYTIKIECNK